MKSLTTDRRQFLARAAALTGAALALPYSRTIRAQQASKQVRLSDRMLAVLGPDANVLVADSDDGLVMVDGGHSSWSQGLLETVDTHFAGPVRALFNTHWHPEHTGSNLALGERGVEIIAHENTKLWLSKDVWVRWSDERYPALAKAALPTTTCIDSGSMALSDRKIEYGYMLNAHTDGDLCVFFPDENVLVAGGLVSNDGWPVVDWWTGGWIGGMLDGFDMLVEVTNQDTRILPARGPLMSFTELEMQRQMYLTIFDRLHTMLRSALSTEEVLAAAPTAEYDGVWGDPEQFLTLAFESMWGHLRDAYSKRMSNIP